MLRRHSTRTPAAAVRLGRWLLLAALLSSGAARAADIHLQSIDASPLGGDRVLVRMHLSAPVDKPQTFTITRPARLSVDLPGTSLALAARFGKLDLGVVRSYAAVEAQGRTRVVLDLKQVVPYTVKVDGDDVLIELAGSVAAAAAASGAASASSYAIDKVDFRRGEDGQGRVVVSLSDPHVPVDVQEQGGKIVARFSHTTVPASLLKRLDVLDFATPVKFVETRRQGSDAEIVVTPVSNGNFQQTSFQAGNSFTLELQPLTQQQVEKRQREHPEFTGQKISLNFQSVDVRALLQIIADVAGVNMVVSDSVKGQIAIRLDDVPWDQALDIILRTKGLGQRRQGNVIFVAPLQELAAREKAELEANKQQTDLAPLHSEVIQVNYAKASDIAALLKSGDNSILSKRGRVSVDERTNTLLVLETLDKLSDIRALVQRLDVPVRQVLIESRIVIANNNFDRQLGAQFGITAVSGLGNNGLVTTSGTNTSTNTTVQSFLNNGRTFPVGIDGTQNDRYNVNLPVTGAGAGTLGLALLGSKYLIDLQLSALQAEGKGEVISTPRVITANAKQASIEQGVEIPYQQSTSSGATSVSFKKAVLSLNVTPQITPDGRIIMDLAVSKDSVGSNVPTGNGGSVPSINTRKVTTQVLVDNGQTVVLGGIYEDTKMDTVNKVPLLGDIPFLGALFRFTEHQDQRTELLIFITPKILNEALKVDSAD